jgi:hypothetical protein
MVNEGRFEEGNVVLNGRHEDTEHHGPYRAGIGRDLPLKMIRQGPDVPPAEERAQRAWKPPDPFHRGGRTDNGPTRQ